jgi:hypothetical protein
MTPEDRTELSQQARLDGRRLFGVANNVYNIVIAINWIIGALGFFGAILCLMVGITQGTTLGLLGAVIIGAITALACFINYVLGVLLTHTAKVMVHTSLATVALLEERSADADVSASSSGQNGKT